MSVKFTNRYDALGIKPPEPGTCCEGECEGTGVVPIYMGGKRKGSVYSEDETEERFKKLWLEAEAKNKTDDGWHFVKCPDCRGTGRREKK